MGEWRCRSIGVLEEQCTIQKKGSRMGRIDEAHGKACASLVLIASLMGVLRLEHEKYTLRRSVEGGLGDEGKGGRGDVVRSEGLGEDGVFGVDWFSWREVGKEVCVERN